jgi:WD40 repeat protein
VTNSGATSIGGDVTVQGLIAAGRDVLFDRIGQLTINVGGEQPPAGGDIGDCPYPGLEPFHADQAGLFYGRTEEIRAVVNMIATAPLAVVVGSSGSGKTSLLNAGVRPPLARDPPPGHTGWTIRTLRSAPNPVEQLTAELRAWARELTEEDQASDTGEQPDLYSSPELFGAFSARMASEANTSVLWIVDQFEKLFDPHVADDERARFVRALLSVRTEPPGRVRVLLGLRSDFYAHLDAYPELARITSEHQYRLLPMGVHALREIVQRPAQQVGLVLEDRLPERILADTGVITQVDGAGRVGAGVLPLLAYALQQTWRHREGNRLTLTAYEASGGVAAAAETAAEQVWARLDGERQETARRIFVRLCYLGGGQRPTGRRLFVRELITNVDDEDRVINVVAPFAARRLLTVDRDPASAEVTVEVAHESLINAWRSLRGWLEADLEAKRLQDELSTQARKWADLRSPDYLLPAGRLAAIEGFRSRNPWPLNEAEQRLLVASRRDARRQRRRSRLLVALPLALLLALAIIAVVTRQQAQTRQAKVTADALQLAAQARAVADEQRPVAALLALAGVRKRASPATKGALVDVLSGTIGPLMTSLPGGSPGTVLAGNMMPDGSVVVGAADGALRIIDPTTGRETGHRPLRQDTAISALAVSPTGTIVSADAIGNVLVQRLHGAQSLLRLQVPHGDHIGAVGFDEKAGVLIVATVEGTVERWRMRGSTVSALPRTRLKESFTSLTVDGDAHLASAGTLGGRVVTFPSAGQHTTITHLNAPGAAGVQLGTTGAHLLAATDGTALSVWPSRRPTSRRVSVAAIGSTAVAADPRSGTLYVGEEDGRVATWSLQTKLIPQGAPRLGLTTSVVGLATDGRMLVGLDSTGRLASWDLTGRRSPASTPFVETTAGVTSVAFSREGNLAAGDDQGRIWLEAAGSPAHIGIRLPAAVNALSWSRDDEIIAALTDGSLRSIEPREGRSSPLVPPGAVPATGVVTGPDGTIVAAWREGLILVRPPHGEIRELHVRTPVTALALGGYHLLAVGSGDQEEAGIDLWRIDHPDSGPQHLHGHSLQIDSLAFSPDGHELASGSDDTQVRLWEMPSGRPKSTLTGHTDMVNALAWSKDGQEIASGGEDGTIKIWDIRTASSIGRPLRFETGFVRALATSPDGSTLASASGNAAVTWPMSDAAWSARVCVLAGRDLTPKEWKQFAPSAEPIPLCHS